MINFTYLRQPPKRYTFEMPKLRQWIEFWCEGKVLNLFAGKTFLNVDEVRVDINVEMNADYYMDAYSFVSMWIQERKAKFGTIIMDPPYCYSEDTDVFTDKGWKEIKDIVDNRLDYKVATLNPLTNELEFHNIINYYKYKYEGEMIHFKQRNVELKVTPNHKLWCRKQWYTHKFKFTEASSVSQGITFQKNCGWKGINKRFFLLPKVDFVRANRYGKKFAEEKKIDMKDWLRFFGIWIAEGSLGNKIKKNRKMASEFKVTITQKKIENRKIIERWLDKLPFHYYKDGIDYRIWDKQLYTYLFKFGKSKQRYIPEDIKNLSSDLLGYLIEGLMLGDGCIYKEEKCKNGKIYRSIRKSYSTASKRLANDFNEIILKTGKSCTIFKQDKNGVFNISIIGRNNFPTIPTIRMNYQKKLYMYKGFVYCIEVPNNILYVRTKGKNQSVWCGNSIRKSREKYEGKYVGNLTKIKNALPSILRDKGRIISLGYDSVGMSKSRGFTKIAICLICHGGDHNDTIGLIEQKDERRFFL